MLMADIDPKLSEITAIIDKAMPGAAVM